ASPGVDAVAGVPECPSRKQAPASGTALRCGLGRWVAFLEVTGFDKRPKAALGALKPLAPYALAYKPRIAAALAALAVASGATLALPVAVRRVVDRGFSEASGEMINAYFGVLILVVGVLAL